MGDADWNQLGKLQEVHVIKMFIKYRRYNPIPEKELRIPTSTIYQGKSQMNGWMNSCAEQMVNVSAGVTSAISRTVGL